MVYSNVYLKGPAATELITWKTARAAKATLSSSDVDPIQKIGPNWIWNQVRIQGYVFIFEEKHW